ncbi:hypothetical protein COU62_01140 [Candidatus Pacearchaeota archaeon CG10_big_fil_rev_8_21_14_0_10_35_219]|nr:hypothetical protein [Candidatus Pacearchaeota archaeon]OIO43043.1 MAG: hypothetical protein AUJ63_01310 [Candidatus Pacearchaeota archaeon CG1_02_35_32]PIO08169.1 MAG: hypothetical protein COU62_01140 [Candidatus Pacearchaeota archaeon CG10_big_fil_rev_8_21_14_0_10_35_219]PIY81101.1 MAG: hypothetical protein COY79_04850 [Candidatus Pacearchaeota archaeon CG_4_10_14_0_8_um_filter_35_169]PIZ79750.1 MAG: hypothetical protein COY00_03385 [Candidatus Pacearchaeota archaeon CG_4_10_14_0_2_um_filt
MKIQPYIEKLNSSQAYKDFEQKHSDAFLIAGFFVLDLESGQNISQIDYYIPSQNKVAAFNMMSDGQTDVKILEMLTKKTPEKLEIATNIDLEALKGILEDEMKNRNMSEEIKKIIAIVQTVEGKKVWNVNCVLSGMEILKAHIEDSSKTVLRMEKASVLDYIKKIPMQQQAQKPKKEDIDKQLQQLDKMKEALQKEKIKLDKKQPKKK